MACPHPLLTELPAGEISHVPGPWILKGDVYMLSTYLPKSVISSIPESLMYSPLEREPLSDKSSCGEFVGGLGMIQIIRYSCSPVGPYDELIVCPGSYTWTEEKKGPGGQVAKKTRKNMRISRIYVSQKFTCWNGRHNWNIPKHLASFDFKDNADGSTTVRVYPHDLRPSTDPGDSKPSEVPLFSATMKPIPYVPAFPMTTNLMGWLGMDISLVQPPLPEGKGSRGELPGTHEWAKIVPVEKSWRTHAVWMDLKQEDLPEGTAVPEGMEGRTENFLPGLKRWNIALKMENAVIEFPEGDHWPKPKLA